MIPQVRISIGGQDITSRLQDRIVEVTITDESGTDSDEVEIVLDDVEGSIEAPRTGVALTIEGGYRETGLVRFGTFTVDQVVYEGWPQRVVISARAVDNLKKLKERRTEAHEDTKLGDLASKIGQRHGLKVNMGKDLAEIPIAYEAQAEESDLALLARLSRRYDSTMTVKDGRLVMTPRAAGKSATGNALPQTVVKPGPGGNLLSYRVTRKEKPKHGKTEAHFFDRKKAKKEAVSEGEDGDDSVVARIREPLQNKDDAKRAAQTRKKELDRGQASASFEIVGTPSALAEAPVLVQDVREQVDGLWNARRVEHRFSDEGYRTMLECETLGGKKQATEDAS